MAEQKQPQVLAAERDALSLYFEALLTGGAEPAEPERARSQPEPSSAPQITETPQAPVAPPAQTPAIEQGEGGAPQRDVTIPQWGEERFQAMLFEVAGLTLAVPLVELSGVREWQAEALTAMPGHAPWYLGLVRYRGHNVPVVDTAHFVLPQDRLARLPSQRAHSFGRIVFIGEGRWGLACDEVVAVVSLGPDQVRWRSERTVRRWLAGTVLEHMCALIEPSEFARMLATGIGEIGVQLED